MEVVPGLLLDPPTLLLSVAVMGFLLAAASFTFAGTLGAQNSGLEDWGIAMLAMGGGFLLFFARGHAPLFLSLLIANVLIIAASSYGLIGHARLFDVEPPWLTIAIVSSFGMSGLMAVYFLGAPRQVGIFTVSLAWAIPVGLTAVTILRNINRNSPRMAWLACAAAAVAATLAAVHAITAISQEAPTTLIKAKPLPIVSAIMGAVFAVTLSMSFFTLLGERRQRETIASLRRDGLTGLLTRLAFFELARELDELKVPKVYSVVMVDIDFFKKVNDTYGHTGGDMVLAHAGRLIGSSVRISDIAGRYGGEEFCILLHECDEAEAREFARRLVVEAAKQRVRLRDGREVTYTLSAGYAHRRLTIQASGRPEEIDDVIARADEALYSAKRAGRNQALGPPPDIQVLQVAT
ncbi:MAG: GGDEF domain-containing protein [Planctomycetales bacterium]|nr:GGDEF domain-containing protein [Planctomycetales bacterium]